MDLRGTLPKPLRAVCPKCKRDLPVRLHGLTRFLVCQGCGHAVQRDTATGYLNDRRSYTSRLLKPYLEPGDEGELFGRRYIVTGWVRKKETNTSHGWVEYHLFGPVHGFAQLSVYQGHWTFHEQLKVYPRASGIEEILIHERNAYERFNSYKCKVLEAGGEFSRDVNDDQRAKLQEYISPPYMLTRELDPDELAWYFGRYLEPSVVQAAFGKVDAPPARKGVGAAQPQRLAIDKNVLKTISVFAVALFLLTQFLIVLVDGPTTIGSWNLHAKPSAPGMVEMVETPSFDLLSRFGAVELLVVPIDLNNRWFSLSGALINEHTGEARSFDLDIEFYSGYEGGEQWTEGSRSGGIIFSALPAGKYHLELYPQYDARSPVHSFRVQVDGSPMLWSNLLVILSLALLFPLITWYRVSSFETKRWSE